MKRRRRTIEETSHRQWRKVENAVPGMSLEDIFKFAFRRGWYLGRKRK